MGGTTSVTLRKPDGEEFRMTRWTNSMPWGICNAKMFNADDKHMNEYLFQWQDMKRDYEANKDTGNFEHNMTECYFPSAGLAPCGYGLTVVDHVTNTIFDMQGYTSFDSMSVAGVSLDMNETKTGFECNNDPDSTFTSMLDFINDDRIIGVTTSKSYDEGRAFDEIESFELEKLLPKIWGSVRTRSSWYQFILDTRPFTIKTFEESSIGAASMFACLEEAGFTFSDDERKEWADWIKEKMEWEEEDGDDTLAVTELDKIREGA